MRARPLAAALVLAAASPAQNRLDAAVDPLFRQLADPKTAAAAQAQLERFGDKILPQLRQRLAPPRYGEAEVRTSILYLLGQLGRAGLPAMREIVDTARDAGAPPGVARQAVWAIGEIGASGTADERRNWTQVLTRQCARRVDSFLVNTVWCRLHLGNTPAKGQVQQWLVEGNDDEATAAAQHLAAEPIEPADRADFVDSLRTALDGAQPRPEFPWEKRGAEAAAPYLAIAWERLSAAPLDPTAARALLRHFDPFQRRRGIAVLATAKLPLHERIDLLYSLWDEDAEVFAATLDALGRGGAENLLALAPLRWHANHNSDAGRRATAAATAAAVLAACGGDQGTAARLLDPEARDPGANGNDELAQAFAALLLGAELCPDGTAPSLIAAAEARSLQQPLALRAVLRLLVHSDLAVRTAALGYLARRGRKVLEAWPDAPGQFGHVAACWHADGLLDDGCFLEAWAWIVAGRDAGASDLLEAIEGRDTRRHVRALAEIVHRGPDALAASRVARAALRERMQAKPRKLLRWLPRIDRFDASPVEIHVDLVPQAEALMELADWVDGVRTAVDADEPAWPALRAFAAQHAVGGARPIGEVLAGPPDFAFAREFAVHIEATASGALDATTVAPRPR